MVVSVYFVCVCKSKCVSVTTTGHAGQRVARRFYQSEHATSNLVETLTVAIQLLILSLEPVMKTCHSTREHPT